MKQTRRFSDRLRDRLGGDASEASSLNEKEREKIRAIAEEVGNREASTIARLMSGSGPGTGRGFSPEAAQRILEQVERNPGCNVHELSRILGEKTIFVLSRVDDLVRDKLLTRLEDGRLFRSLDEEPPVEIAHTDDHENHRAVAQKETSLIFLRVFRFLTIDMKTEPCCNGKMLVSTVEGKFLEMKKARGCVHFTLYGNYSRDLVERFKSEVELASGRINFSPLTGILDIRSCRFDDLDAVLPWIARFYLSVQIARKERISEVSGKNSVSSRNY